MNFTSLTQYISWYSTFFEQHHVRGKKMCQPSSTKQCVQCCRASGQQFVYFLCSEKAQTSLKIHTLAGAKSQMRMWSSYLSPHRYSKRPHANTHPSKGSNARTTKYNAACVEKVSNNSIERNDDRISHW